MWRGLVRNFSMYTVGLPNAACASARVRVTAGISAASVWTTRRPRPDAHRFVGEAHVLGVAVGLGMHDDGLDAHFAARALNAQRDLAAVGDQDLVEQLVVGLGGGHVSPVRPPR